MSQPLPTPTTPHLVQFIKQSGCLHLSSPLSLPSPFSLAHSLCFSHVPPCAELSLSFRHRGLERQIVRTSDEGDCCSATGINAPRGMICLVQRLPGGLCAHPGVPVSVCGTRRHNGDLSVCLSICQVSVFYRLNSRVRGDNKTTLKPDIIFCLSPPCGPLQI